MIIAGPGNGKTSTMAGRVLTLLQEGIALAQHSGDDFHNSCGIRDQGSYWVGGRERGCKRALSQHISLILFAALPVPCRKVHQLISFVYQECLGTWKAILVDKFQDTSSMQY
ncbi:putative DNA helicase [Dioscorea sansibarensis]